MRCNIHILCESTHDKKNSLKKYIDVQINRTKKALPMCKGLDAGTDWFMVELDVPQ